MTNSIRYRLRDWSMMLSSIFALVLTVGLPLMLILEPRAPAIHAVLFGMWVQLKLIAAVQMSRVAAHRDLVVFQIADAGAAGVACFWGRVAVAVGVAAQLGADAEHVAEDVLEEGFEGWDCGGDEAGVELGADPDCDSCSVVCGFGEYFFCGWFGFSNGGEYSTRSHASTVLYRLGKRTMYRRNTDLIPRVPWKYSQCYLNDTRILPLRWLPYLTFGFIISLC